MKNRIILLGPPASGKGTQASLLAAAFGLPAASTGAMLRDEKARGSAIGLEADQWTSQGKLFPDELALRVVWGWLDGRKRFLLDGFPRTLGQAQAFDAGLVERELPVDVVYFLNLAEEIVRERMMSRLTCEQCGAVFNEKFHKVTPSTPCPKCGGTLGRRADDTQEALDSRLDQYRTHTLPVIAHYRDQGLLTEVDVAPGRDEVFKFLYNDVQEKEAA